MSASVYRSATGGSDWVREWHDSYVNAYQEGLRGELQPNNVYNPKNSLFQEVPDVRVRHYFLPYKSDAPAALRPLGLRVYTVPAGDLRILTITNVEHLGLEESRPLSLALIRVEDAGVTVEWASLPGP